MVPHVVTDTAVGSKESSPNQSHEMPAFSISQSDLTYLQELSQGPKRVVSGFNPVKGPAQLPPGLARPERKRT